MRFLADMCMDVRVANWLNFQGHDSTHLRDAEPPPLRGKMDLIQTGEGNGLESGKEENTSSNTQGAHD